jgi:hypothetical protein
MMHIVVREGKYGKIKAFFIILLDTLVEISKNVTILFMTTCNL